VLSFRLEQLDFVVTGIHNSPLRPLAYVDLSAADALGLDGLTNLITVTPASENVTDNDIKAALFNQPGVISAQPASELASLFDEVIELFALFLGVVNVVVVIMAFLIAFNSTSINVDERSREIATMFAFGLPIRTVARMQVVENLITGFIGTVLGIVLGWVILVALVNTVFAEQLADLGMITAMSAQTLVLSLVLGIAVVGLTPLLSIRRMRKMDLPSTLRVME
jgi:putative ABC transport system permease protein